jgi:hypothetical protein
MDNEETIYALLRQGEILEVEKALKSLRVMNEKLLILDKLTKIFRNEVNGNSKKTVFDYSTDIDQLSQHYTKTKLLLRRIDFDMPRVCINEIYEYFEDNMVSVYMLEEMVKTNMVNKVKVCMGLAELYGGRKGTGSFEAGYFLNLKNIMGGK